MSCYSCCWWRRTGWGVTFPFRQARTCQYLARDVVNLDLWSWNVNLSIFEPQKFRRKLLGPHGKNDLANWESARDKSMHASPQLFWLFWKSSCFQREAKVIPPGKDGVTATYWCIIGALQIATVLGVANSPFCFRWFPGFETWDFQGFLQENIILLYTKHERCDKKQEGEICSKIKEAWKQVQKRCQNYAE